MSGDRKERRAVAVSRSAYERVLAVYPKRFRELYGEEMVDVFEDGCCEQVRSGSRGRLMWFWCRSIADLLGSAALERKRCAVGFSVVRWGGLLAAVGGMILAASGLLMSWLLTSMTLSYAWYAASIGQMVGMLLLALSLTGLAALVARNGGSNISFGRRVRVSSIRRLMRAQWSTVIGVLLILVAVLSALGLLAVFTMYEVVGIGGSARLYPGGLENFLYSALGLLATFGLPLALILLGVAVWRSGEMGRWSLLPVCVGVATFLIPLTIITVGQVLWEGYLPQSSFFAAFATIGMPALVIGCMWTLLGLTVERSEADRSLERLANKVVSCKYVVHEHLFEGPKS